MHSSWDIIASPCVAGIPAVSGNRLSSQLVEQFTLFRPGQIL
jgi:hypothetical protein